MDIYNQEIKIPFPPDAKKIEDRLRSLGLNKLVDEAILFINSSKNAATEAKPLIIQAIKNMTIKDAINIVKGKEDEATDYLKINIFDFI